MQELLKKYNSVKTFEVKNWFRAGTIDQFPSDSGACVKYNDKQIAVFNFTRTNTWYACQNLCPHRLEMVLSRGMTGDLNDIPKIACPLHKKTFSLIDGKSLGGDDLSISVYPVKIEDENVYIGFTD
ncbi:nitrite reductase small subunit NirD [Robertkochia solimangrovi]|uniref:nitrite reductase small subunit NirD n=1 Tax=Robertkochia solimangrovi TaxID=2213046 RepID=UPI0011802AEB|nr:nitrite reductase small subunit NirD [Robertkochia solimangrovi]TRZ42281.1 nitrite reductase (NAD(P)H) small subunit [Robertkochia solimangrovi]